MGTPLKVLYDFGIIPQILEKGKGFGCSFLREYGMIPQKEGL
jgi:hypothetical protein